MSKDPSNQHIRNQIAIRLLREWQRDDSGYDEAVWPIVKEIMEGNRLSVSPPFSAETENGGNAE